MADFDLAVVGAGPAGSAAARSFLLERGGAVALIDKARFPRDKSCGDGLGPGVVRVLEQLGLGDLLKSFSPIKQLAVSSPAGIHVAGPLPLVGGKVPVGYVIPRKRFDEFVFRAALDAGAADHSGAELSSAEYDSDKSEWKLTIKDEAGEPKTISAKYVVGADGPRSKVRRILGQPFNDNAHTGTAVRIYCRTSASFSEELRLDFLKQLLPAYGWVFPIDRSSANIGVGIDVSRYQERRRHLNTLLEDYQATLPGITVETDSRLSFILPYGSQLPRISFAERRAALVGDAASMVNPLTGEGIYYGMWAGLEAGKSVAAAIARNQPGELSKYEARFREKFSEHYKTNQIMKNRVAHPTWCDIVISACAKDRKVLGELIDLMMGDRKRISLALLGRIAAGGIL